MSPGESLDTRSHVSTSTYWPHIAVIVKLRSWSAISSHPTYVVPCTLVIYYSTPRQTQTLADSIEFYYNNTAWRDFEIKFMIFNLNSFRVLGPLAIMDHTWTLGGDLSGGNGNENLNCKLWFWIWNFHGTQRIFFISLYVDELLKELGLQSFQHWGDGHMVA